MSQSLQNFDHETLSNVQVRYLYQGKPIEKDYLEQHPEIHRFYMPSARVNAIYTAVSAGTLKGMCSIIDVTENGVSYSVGLCPVSRK